MSTDIKLKMTVITVVYNAADRLRSTIESVLGQDYDNIEYIIKDGGSTDATIDVIKEYAGRNSRIRYVSSKDFGIYDAMNAAVGMATGEAIEFLNAGDRFASTDVVSSAMKVMADTDSDIVYGDVLYENPDGTTEVRAYPRSCAKKIYYLTGDCINHQVMFVKKSLFDGALFDTRYKICADREWMLRIGAYSPNRKMTSLGSVVAVYPLDGQSLINKERYRVEAGMCIRKHMPFGYPVYLVFEFFRSNKLLSGLLHSIYKHLYMNR